VREAYASTLDPPTGDEYRVSFNTAVLKRFRRFAGFLEDA
jgi:hypothetical protein